MMPRLPSLAARRSSVAIPALALLLPVHLMTACGEGDEPADPTLGVDAGTDTDEGIGESEFVSAAGLPGQEGENTSPDAGAAPPGTNEGRGDEADPGRTVEEGDIYRLMETGTLLNLNAFRGLQVIDYSDLANPRIVGRLQVAGTPVEMYTVGNLAYVLLNDWTGYYGSRDDIRVQQRQGGLVLAVDLSDPTRPREVARAFIPGAISTSRLTRQGDRAALYAVASWYGEFRSERGDWSWSTHTVVQSWDLTGGALTARTQLDLGGYVAAVQATPQHLLVSRYDWQNSSNRSLVSVIDISNPDGSMQEGAQVQARGMVQKKTSMDLYRGVLRIVSADNWGPTRTNWLETFDATDITDLRPLDADSFGDGMDLFATLFLGNKAFFVTYFRVDPLHAFEILDDGQAQELSEFEITGWNDWFRPVFDESRMIGIGVNDEGGSNTLAVSLYDITDLTNPNPFIARAEVAADSSWSEASWDDRAFSVVENAVAIESPEGVLETGLVLLPFSGWDSDAGTYQASVQIYTFSTTTLTRRGVMDHGTQVRRSFLADDDVTANLSEAAVSFFDTHDPDAPEQASSLELAPNFTRLWVAGDHLLRLKDSTDWYWGWWGPRAKLPDSVVEVIPAGARDPDAAEAVATIAVPARSTVVQAGNMLVSLAGLWVEDVLQIALRVYDLSNPATPRTRGTLTTPDLAPQYSWGGGGPGRPGRPGVSEDCWDCGWGHSVSLGNLWATSRAVTFLQPSWQQEELGMTRYCDSWINSQPGCGGAEEAWEGRDDEERPAPEICEELQGYRHCVTREGQEEVCQGSFQRCTWSSGGEYTCVEADLADLDLETRCYEYMETRNWQQYTFRTVDLTNPDAPALSALVELPAEEEGMLVTADGDTLWVTTRIPWQVEGDSRPYVRYQVRGLNVANPAAPVLGPAINVPGRVFAVRGDQIYTQDEVWGERRVDTAVNRLRREETRAVRLASYRFSDQWLEQLVLDDAGHMVASHRPVEWDWWNENSMQRLTLFDDQTLQPVGTTDIDRWASLTDAGAGRALFSVPGGMLVVNTEDGSRPTAQAWFPTRGWPESIQVVGDRVVFAAGRFGLSSFGLNTSNLLPLD
jgi:hypothetical protein